MYERAFTLDANGDVTLNGDRIEVEPVVTYEPVLMSAEPDEVVAAKGARNSKADQQKIQAMHDHSTALGAACDPKAATTAAPKAASTCGCNKPASGDKQMEKNERVKALIAKSKVFTEADQKFLEGASDESLARYEAAEKEAPAAPVVAAAAAVPAVVVPEVKVAEVKPVTFADVLKTADSATQDLINAGLAAGKARKDASIKALKDSGRCMFADADLEAKTQGELDSLVKLAGVEPKAASNVDYSGQGTARTDGNPPAGVPAAPDLNTAVKAAAAAKVKK